MDELDVQGEMGIEERRSPDFQVGAWRVAPRGNRMVGPAGTERVEPKVMQVLECLAETPGRTVTKERFMDRVWAGTVVSDDVLARCISELRKVFGDDPRRPAYIETVRKSGYRLIAPVTVPAPHAPAVEEGGVEEAPEPDAPEDRSPPAGGEPPGPIGDGDAGAAPPLRPRVVAPAVEAPARAEPPVPRHGLQWGLAAAVVVLLGLVLGVVVRGDAEPRPLKTVPFTSFPGREADPALSPTGDRLAFAWGGPDGRNVDIYVKQHGAETPLRLTSDPAREYSPAWSPDGREIAFVRAGTATERDVVIVPAIGGSERRAARFEEREVAGVAWSPDGETLAVSAQTEPGGPFALFLLSAETLERRQLTEPPRSHRGDTDPAFSPNGDRLAFVRSAADGADDLFTVPVRGGEPERLTHDVSEILGLDWAPDGQGIVLASRRAEGAGLWRVPIGGGTPEWIMTAGEGKGIGKPSLARRGGRLAFEQRSSDANIWAIRSGRFDRTPLVHSSRWESNPQFSPDGARIAFASDRSGSPEVWLSDADGANPLQLTAFGGAAVSMPRWSPDSRRIAFDARTEDGADIYVLDAHGGQPARLTQHPADDLAPSWSQDSTTVYFSSNRTGRWEVWQIPADGGTPAQVTFRGGYNAFESPDGRYLYYAKKGEPGLWRYGLLGAEDETLVLGALEPFDWGNWALTRDGIYFIRREDVGPTIRFYSFLSGRSSPIATLDEVPEQPSLAVSPDGRVLLYTHVDRNESDILLVEDFR
jgi:Tol biopolymer transport system component/DNA-binding winged helix-turn-helix (wHTH) protein